MEEPKVLPVGEPTFEKIITNNCLYVDKTELIYTLLKKNQYVFLSRPRRFGKSLLISTIKAYFEGKKELFKGLAMENLETEWKQYPIFHFDFSDMKTPTPALVEETIDYNLQQYEKQYNIQAKSTLSNRLRTIVTTAVEETKQPAVLLIDEYDAPMLNALHEETFEAIKLIMQQFYSPLKLLTPYWKFVMLTGISKFSQLGIFSQLNNITNISMDAEYDAISGFTKEELLTTFKPYIKLIAKHNKLSYKNMLADLKHWYDGYHFGDGQHDIYNPYSVLKALHHKKLSYYWYESGTGEYLIKLCHDASPNLFRIAEGWTMHVTRFDVPAIDTTSIIPMLYQAGYLTIKNADPANNIYTLGIPNHEVKVGMMENLLDAFVDYKNNVITQDYINDAYIALLRDNLDGFMTNMQAFFANVSYENYKNLGLQNMLNYEQFFHTLFFVAISFMNIHIRTEVKSPEGSVDAIVYTRNRVYIMEFKLNGTAEQAIAQIHEKKHYDTVKHLQKETWLVGVEFGKKSKKIEEWIVEKIEK